MVSKLELLRKQVSVVVNLAKPGHDKCVITVTSPGGAVSQYGLAASQLVCVIFYQLVACHGHKRPCGTNPAHSFFLQFTVESERQGSTSQFVSTALLPVVAT